MQQSYGGAAYYNHPYYAQQRASNSGQSTNTGYGASQVNQPYQASVNSVNAPNQGNAGYASNQSYSMKNAKRKPQAHHGVTLAQIVAAGGLQPGTYNFTVGTTPNVQANINRNGEIEYRGQTYTNPSRFALDVHRSHYAGRQAASGWTEIKIPNYGPIGQLRKWYAQNYLNGR